MKTVCRLNSIENLLLVVVNDTLNRQAGNNVECGSGWHVSFFQLRPTISPLIVSINSLTRADGGGSASMSLRQTAGFERDDQRLLCSSLRRNGRISSHGPVIFRYNDPLDPGGVINSVQVLLAEIRGYGDDGLAATELWS